MDGNNSKCVSQSCSSAVQLLKEDQLALAKLFLEFEQVDDFKKKEEIVGAISAALSSYFSLEAEVVYPTLANKAAFSQDLCAGAESHHQAKLVLDRLQRLTADVDDAAYDKAVQDLRVVVEKHFSEECQTFFPALDKCTEKVEELDQKLKQFKAEQKFEESQERAPTI
ncbi:hemerythrin domain-containing protein [bacterium]|nr:hemerythrin domain-containing protein [bacterium]MBP9811534.1 hemerythrin domain-containing protein [bacterium]